MRSAAEAGDEGRERLGGLRRRGLNGLELSLEAVEVELAVGHE